MKPLRLAIIGGGHLGYIHTKLARENSGFRLVAVCDPQPRVQQRIIQEFDLRAVSNWMKIIGEFEAAIIATPTVSHHEIACELIRHGVHLLVEKPLAATAAEAAEITALAAEHRVTVQVGHVESFNPALQNIPGQVGTPFLFRAARHGGYTFRSTDVSVVQDLMIHDIDLACEVLGGDVTHVEASGTTLFGPHLDVAEARISFSTGGVALLSASRCCRKPCRTVEVAGSDGWVEIDLNTRGTDHTRIGEWIRGFRESPQELSPADQSRIRDSLFHEYLPHSASVADPANAIALEQADWIQAIRSGKPCRIPAARGQRAVEIAETIGRLADASAWNVLPESESLQIAGRIGPAGRRQRGTSRRAA